MSEETHDGLDERVAALKQKSRDADEEALRTGRITAEELNRKNNIFWGRRFKVDLRSGGLMTVADDLALRIAGCRDHGERVRAITEAMDRSADALQRAHANTLAACVANASSLARLREMVAGCPRCSASPVTTETSPGLVALVDDLIYHAAQYGKVPGTPGVIAARSRLLDAIPGATPTGVPLIDNGRGQLVYAPTEKQAEEADAFIRSRLVSQNRADTDPETKP